MRLITWLKLPELSKVKELDDPSATLLHSTLLKVNLFYENYTLIFIVNLKRSYLSSPSQKY